MTKETTYKLKQAGLSSFALHIIAMLFMLCDHSWATLFPWLELLTCIGRIAFPIFAFMIAEGFLKTSNRWKYIKRMAIFAVISEIPFNLMTGSSFFNPIHQNVLWTFTIALLLMQWIEYIKLKNKILLTIFIKVLAVLIGFIMGTLTFVDYYGFGVLTVLLFYEFHDRKLWNLIVQIVVLYIFNVEGIGGLYYPIHIFGHEFELVQQGLALLALIPIWLYNGKQGYHAKWFKWFCYIFYPAHMLVLYIIWQIMLHFI